MNIVLTLLAFILILGAIIFFHELGHFITAKISGVKVEEFAFGFGPQIFGIARGDTLYRINLLPIGGYVKMLGEEEESSAPGSFSIQPISKRMIIIVAGVTMNLILASVVYFIFLAINNFTLVIPLLDSYDFKFGKVEKTFIINFVEENSPAEEAGLKPGTIINSVDGITTLDSLSFRDYVLENEGKELTLRISDIYSEAETEVIIVPRVSPPEGQGAIGVVLLDAVRLNYYGVDRILSGLEHSLNMIGYSISVFKDLVVSAIKYKDITYVSENIHGPIGVYVATDMTLRTAGFVGLLDITGLMSATLAFINILPFPALDGGHVILLLLEKVRGKKLNPGIEKWLNLGGFIILMLVMFLISAKDLFQFGIVDKLIFWR